MPKLYIISGCNGAGKTTASNTILPGILNCKEFVNADYIASELSPYKPETVAVTAGKIMLNRINNLLNHNITFAIETTLSSKTLADIIIKAKDKNYDVILIYFWLIPVKLAIYRIKERVRRGGHNIGDDVVLRRYYKGLKNLFNVYMNLVDYWIIFDNSGDYPEKVAYSDFNGNLKEKNKYIFERIKAIVYA